MVAKSIIQSLRREVHEARQRTGMIAGMPKVTVDANHLEHVLAHADAAAHGKAAIGAPTDEQCQRFFCLAHDHAHRWEEALCSAEYQLDEARKELAELQEMIRLYGGR